MPYQKQESPTDRAGRFSAPVEVEAQPPEPYPQDDWPPIGDVSSEAEPPLPYPIDALPSTLAAFVDAGQYRGLAAPLTASASIAAFMLCAAEEFDVHTLASGKPRPCTINVIAVAASGFRKTTIFDAAFDGHINADDDLYRRWQQAKRKAAEGKSSDEDEQSPLSPALKRPTMMQGDSTIEASMMSLSSGRRTQMLVNSEGNSWARGWSQQPKNRAFAFAKLSERYDGSPSTFDRRADGTELYITPDRRFSVCLAAQGKTMLDVVLSDEAQDGFAARTFICQVTERPADGTDEDIASTEPEFSDIGSIVADLRKRIDRGREYAEHDSGFAIDPRGVIEMDQAAARSAREMHTADAERADRLGDNPLMQSVALRATENAIRLAAVFTYIDAVSRAPDQRPRALRIDARTIEDAREVVDWHVHESHRLSAVAGITRMSEEVTKVVEVLSNPPKAAAYDHSEGTLLWTQVKNSIGELKRDPEFAERVLEMLGQLHIVRPVPKRRGRYEINPELRP